MRARFQKPVYGLVLLFVFLLHVTYLPNGFVWLDHGDIEAKRTIVPLTQTGYMFESPFGQTGFYRPVITFLNSTDYALYGLFAPGYHLTNVLLHVAVVAVVPLFLSVFFTFTFSEIIVVMLIVGIHPLGWLPVGAIGYRPELLVTLFILLAVYFHAKARLTSSPFFATIALITFFCGLVTKETSLVLIPLLILLWEFTTKKVHTKSYQTTQNYILSLFLPETIVVGLYIFMRMQAVPQVWSIQQYQLSLAEAVGTRMVVLGELLLDFVNPMIPPLSDAVRITGIFSMSTALVLILFGGSCYVIFKQGLFSSWTKVLILFFIMLLPALAVVPVPRLGSPHYGYIPLVAFSAVIILVLRIIPRIKKHVTLVSYGVITLWIVIMSYATLIGGTRFFDDRTLFEPEVTKNEYFYEGHFYLGNYYFLQKDYESAEVSFKKAQGINTEVIAYHERTASYINLAIVKLEQGKTKEAIALLEKAKRYGDPRFTKSIILMLAQIKHGKQ